MTVCAIRAKPCPPHVLALPQPGGDRLDFGDNDEREGDQLRVDNGD